MLSICPSAWEEALGSSWFLQEVPCADACIEQKDAALWFLATFKRVHNT